MAGHRNKVSSKVGILAYVSISIYNNVQNLQHLQTVVVANLPHALDNSSATIIHKLNIQGTLECDHNKHQLGDLLECITSKQHAYLQQSKSVYQGS